MRFTTKRARRINIETASSEEFGFDLMQKHRVKAFLDLGANCGVISIRARMTLPKARIIAVDPNPDVQRCLMLNTAGWDVERIDKAIGPDGLVVRFNTRFLSLAAMIVNKPMIDCVSVECISLPTLMRDLKLDPKTTAIKMDIEGGEWHSMMDAESMKILRACPHLAFEYHEGPINMMGHPALTAEEFKIWVARNWMSTHYVRMFGVNIPRFCAIKL